MSRRQSKLTLAADNVPLATLEERTAAMRRERPRPLCDVTIEAPGFASGCVDKPSLKPLMEQDSYLLNERRPSYIGSSTKRDLGMKEMAAFQVFRPQGRGNVGVSYQARRIIDTDPQTVKVCQRKSGVHLQDYMKGTTLPECSEHNITSDEPLRYNFTTDSLAQTHLERLRKVWDANPSRRFTFGLPP